MPTHKNDKVFPFVLTLCVFFLCAIQACSTTSVSTYVHNADQLVAADKIDEAIILYQNAIHDHPDNVVLYINQASLFRKKQQHTHAIRNYQTLLKINPSLAWPYIGLAKVYMAEKRYEKAKKALWEGLDQLPNDRGILFYLGQLAYQTKNPAQALTYFQQAIEQNFPHPDKIYYYQGLVYDELLNDKQNAKYNYDLFLTNAPADSEKIETIKNKLSALNTTVYEF